MTIEVNLQGDNQSFLTKLHLNFSCPRFCSIQMPTIQSKREKKFITYTINQLDGWFKHNLCVIYTLRTSCGQSQMQPNF